MKNISILFFIFFFNSLQAQNIGVKLPVSTSPNTSLDVNGSVAFREGTVLTLVNGVNSDVVLGDFTLFRIAGPTAPFSITGFSNGQNGRILTLINTTSQILMLTHLATSSAANQINTSGTSVSLLADGVAVLAYNTTLSQWVLTGGQGFKYNWSLTGNAGTMAASHFIGTTDAKAFALKANNTEGGYILPSGNVGMGTQTAQNKLDVEGRAVIGATYAGTNTAPANGLLVEGITGFGSALKIGTSSSSINASSALEIESTTKSFVPPRMITAQMNAIASPLVGSIVFNTTLSSLHQYKSPGGWTDLVNITTPFVYEALQTSILSQSFGSAFADIPGVGGLSIAIPRTGTYTIIARAYFANGRTSSGGNNAGAQGSFKIVVDGTSYEESFLASLGIYNADDGFNFWGLGTQGMIIKTLSINAGTHTISMQGRAWSGTNCPDASWGIDTSVYVNSGGADVAWCKLTIVEN
jgi:hypothetical protein